MPDTALPAGIGHNSAPLGEVLAEITGPLLERSGKLLEAAGRASCTDDDTAGKCATLAKMIKDHTKAVDGARTTAKEPYLQAGRDVDAHFKVILAPLEKAAKAVVDMIDAYRREQQRLLDEQRRRAETEARARAEEAARLAAEAAATNNISAEIAAQQLQEQADAAANQAASIGTATVTSDYGVKAVGTTSYGYAIDDVAALAVWLATQHPAELSAVLLPLLPKVAGKPTKTYQPKIPGVRIEATTRTAIR
ncbi:hypothetical protein VPG91_11685 [Nitrospirillum amazonense]|uniref:hypothetical protein n=1 Tax=Nitrospirillum amazonense TaxID=28077 RepID=UPI002DD44086|nr:hypothetical protein [Nitrospirillum amazonense]MEC4591651.1 hypothetical protein [Nitrospirillum amazonense]